MSKTSPGSSATVPAVSTRNPPFTSAAGQVDPVVIHTPPTTVSVHGGVVVPIPTLPFVIFPDVVVVVDLSISIHESIPESSSNAIGPVESESTEATPANES